MNCVRHNKLYLHIYILPAVVGCIKVNVFPNPLNADLNIVGEAKAIVARSLGLAFSPIPHAKAFIPNLRSKLADVATSSLDGPWVSTYKIFGFPGGASPNDFSC